MAFMKDLDDATSPAARELRLHAAQRVAAAPVTRWALKASRV
jgi:hypothetical protein